MKAMSKMVLLALMLSTVPFSLYSCHSAPKTADFSNAQHVAELATLECYFHNVARFDRTPDNILFNIGEIGKKQLWFEYSGIVRFGVDATKVRISEPDSEGNIVIAIPQAQILGNPDIDETSMSDPLTSTGWFTDITTEEKQRALNSAQDKLLEVASNDDELLSQARDRAKTLLEQYVVNVGNEIGQTYKVTWTDAE